VIRIDYGDDAPLGWLRYRNAARGGGTVTERLAIEQAWAAWPALLDAVVLVSDLQGVVADPHTGESTLLGVAVAEYLDELAFDELIPPPQRTGVILAGDLYSVPSADKRGGHGDVAPVWAAFAQRFAWVAGVAGNHDNVDQIAPADHVHLLDGEQRVIDQLRIGGVGRIIGNPDKRGRRDEDDQLARIADAGDGVDLLVLHEGPHGSDRNQRGHPAIRALIDRMRVPLTVCGHDHWAEPVAATSYGQIVNVDARVIVVRRRAPT
jgi:3',5'-cyclic-AMP phosphodiesterase